MDCSDRQTTHAQGFPVDFPLVAAIRPHLGPAAGDTAEVLHGDKVRSGASVILDGQPARDVVLWDWHTLTTTIPAHVPGVPNIVVMSPGGAVCQQVLAVDRQSGPDKAPAAGFACVGLASIQLEHGQWHTAGGKFHQARGPVARGGFRHGLPKGLYGQLGAGSRAKIIGRGRELRLI